MSTICARCENEDFHDDVWQAFDDEPPMHRASSVGHIYPTIDVHGDIETFVRAMRAQVGIATAVGKIPMLRAIASELFPGPIKFEVENDPEIGAGQYLVISVTSHSSHDVSKLRKDWYQRTILLLEDVTDRVQLVIMVHA